MRYGRLCPRLSAHALREGGRDQTSAGVLRVVVARESSVARAQQGRGPMGEGGAAAASAHVTVRGLTKHFPDAVVYDRFDLDIPHGKLVSIFGPNGCGKST